MFIRSSRNALVARGRARLPRPLARHPAPIAGLGATGRAETRADAASALARVYLHSDLDPLHRADAAEAMATLIDDPCVEVRRALAEALSGARNAPRYLVVALANDEAQVAAPILARSPLLTDAELVDCAATGGVVAQCAIARRSGLGAGPRRGAGGNRRARGGAGVARQFDRRPYARRVATDLRAVQRRR